VAAHDSNKPTFDDELRIAMQFPRPFFEACPLPIDGFREGPAEVACPIDLRDPKGTIGRIVEARDCGADALWIWVDRRSSSWGRLTAGAFALFLEAADGAPLYLDGRGAAPALAALLIASTQRIDNGLERLVGGFDIDPLGTLAADGSLPTSLVGAFDLMAEALKWCEELAPRMRTVAVSTIPHAKAGATAVQELATTLATGVAYMREMEKRGLAPAAVNLKLRFVTTMGRDLFMETAKLRALRILWQRVAEACDVSRKASVVPIHAVASPRCLTVRDPWVNLLRGTAAAYTGVIGGADVVTVLPFDSVAGKSDELARRLAINTSNILREESFVDRVGDPTAGSYLVESLTSDLCAAAWEEFQRIESAGGMVDMLRSGALARELAESLAAKRQRIVTLREPVTGVSSFPNIEEEPIHRHRAQRDPRRTPDEVPTAVHRAVGASSGSFTAALESAHGGISATELVDVLKGSDEKDNFSPVAIEREARPFEALRDISDSHLLTAGVRPKIFVASVGQSQETRRTTSFVVNLLASGGLIAVLGEDLDGVEALAAAFAASGSRAAIICASPDATEVIPPLAREFTALRARRVYVTGNPGRLETVWREAGVNGFIRRHTDAVALLTDLLEAEGVDHD
jgi:methylmalonyl-CoA mutase